MARFKTDRTYVIVSMSDVRTAWLDRAVVEGGSEFIQRDITRLRKSLDGTKVILKYHHAKGKPSQLQSERTFTHEEILAHIRDEANGWLVDSDSFPTGGE